MRSREESAAQWSASYRLVAAEKWKAKSAAMGRAATETLVEYADPQPGMKVLDLASGTGEPSITLAGRVGPEGHVTALDQSADLLEIASGRAQQRGLTNFTIQQGDAHDLSFPNQVFDLITCRHGVMFFDNVHLALGEGLRVLKPGARACFLAWGPFEQPYWANTVGIVHRHTGGELLGPGPSNPFRFSQRGSLSAALAESGFGDVHEETRNIPWTWPGSVEELWEYVRSVSTPFRPLLERVPAESWEQINARIHQALAKYVQPEGVALGATMVLASGRKPTR